MGSSSTLETTPGVGSRQPQWTPQEMPVVAELQSDSCPGAANSAVAHDCAVTADIRRRLGASPYPEVPPLGPLVVYHEGALILHGTVSSYFFLQMALVAINHGRLPGVESVDLKVAVQPIVREPSRFDWEVAL